MEINDLIYSVIGIALKVHSKLGPGSLESAYKEMLFYNLTQAGFNVQREMAVPLINEGVRLKCGYRLDLLVEGVLVVEVKAIDTLHPIHTAQVLTYLRTGGFHLGLLINFNVLHLNDGLKRIIL